MRNELRLTPRRFSMKAESFKAGYGGRKDELGRTRLVQWHCTYKSGTPNSTGEIWYGFTSSFRSIVKLEGKPGWYLDRPYFCAAGPHRFRRLNLRTEWVLHAALVGGALSRAKFETLCWLQGAVRAGEAKAMSVENLEPSAYASGCNALQVWDEQSPAEGQDVINDFAWKHGNNKEVMKEFYRGFVEEKHRRGLGDGPY